MKNFSSYKLEDLVNMKKILENEELQKQLLREIELRENQTISIEQYASNRLPEFYEEYKDQCLKLLSELSFTELNFLIHSARYSAGNNLGGYEEVVIGLREYIITNQYPTVVKTIDDYFIEKPEMIYFCEGVYNTLNYIKTAISVALNSKKGIEAKKDLFFDFDEKKELVTKNLKDISKHLFQLRQSVPNSRLCVVNQSLIKNTTKYGVTITKSQDKFISSIAFGSTLEKLKEGNYEETERLLFVPQCKMVKK